MRRPSSPWFLPVRYLRVLYALTRDDYRNVKRSLVAAGHEFFCRHSSLGSHTSQTMRRFFDAMAPKAHFLTET